MAARTPRTPKTQSVDGELEPAIGTKPGRAGQPAAADTRRTHAAVEVNRNDEGIDFRHSTFFMLRVDVHLTRSSLL
jgi:hypothetical protein